MHIEITIEANEHQQEELISLLNDFNPEGYEQNDHALIAYFPAKEYDPGAMEQILHGFDHTSREIHEQNWNKVWESNFEPVIVDDFCAIRAEFHQPIRGVQHEIVITPKMSFGTGHHATTHMMIQQMKDLVFQNKNVFDFGTGTGILAILAEKLGARDVIAIDVDDWSIENAQENLYRNNCSHVQLSLNSSVPERQFDIILANINR
ncbi:MAG TPA: 50S ribosomal protein L11 methyltransferase, partial [Chitinophagaceae bacterium]